MGCGQALHDTGNTKANLRRSNHGSANTRGHVTGKFKTPENNLHHFRGHYPDLTILTRLKHSYLFWVQVPRFFQLLWFADLSIPDNLCLNYLLAFNLVILNCNPNCWLYCYCPALWCWPPHSRTNYSISSTSGMLNMLFSMGEAAHLSNSYYLRDRISELVSMARSLSGRQARGCLLSISCYQRWIPDVAAVAGRLL